MTNPSQTLTVVAQVCEIDGLACTQEAIEKEMEDLLLVTVLFYKAYDSSIHGEDPVVVQHHRFAQGA